MKFFLICFLAFVAHYNTLAQSGYDSVLSKKLNADPYGMKKYVLVILKTGQSIISDKAKRDSIFRGHMQNIQLLASQKKLVIAGPMGENDKKYEGIFIFNTGSIKEAEKMLQADPAFSAGLLEAELYNWYASAALQQIPDLHKKLQRQNF